MKLLWNNPWLIVLALAISILVVRLARNACVRCLHRRAVKVEEKP